MTRTLNPSRKSAARAAVAGTDEAWIALMVRVLALVTVLTIAVAAAACTSGNAGGSSDRPISAPPGRGS